jgi:UDP-glucose 4-epimerase
MILVTGGAGFIGSQLCARLVALGHDVVSLDNYSAGSRENHVAGVYYVEGHTKDIACQVKMQPRAIFHLGEFSRVDASFGAAPIVYESNVVGTAAVLDYWKSFGCRLIYAGSSTRFAEDDSASPYSRSKAQNADLVLEFGRSHKLSHAVSYLYNVYGPGERYGETGTLIEIFRHKVLHNEPLPVVLPGTQRRNFTHVDDVVDGLMLLLDKGEGEFPIGADDNYSVLEVAGMFGSSIAFLPEREGNRCNSAIDTSAIRMLGWRQQRHLVDYIAEISLCGAT